MNQQKRINKIADAVEARIQDEVGALLGSEFSLISGDRKSVTKKDVFSSLLGKQICAQMAITGEVSGKGCLLIGIKDAIRLGGTLIMLPSGELDEVIGREEYSEEIEDSFGEIANIIAGSFTKDFEEMYPESCRFVRKEQEVIVPVKVEIDTDSPIENQEYYQVSCSMVLDGRQMGDMIMLMPAVTFGLQEQIQQVEPAVVTDVPEAIDKEQPAPPHRTEDSGGSQFDTEKHKKKVDRLLADCQKKMEKEMSALLGADIILGKPENRLLGKEEFFSENVSGKQILADMEVVGEMQGKSYLAVSVKDAIHLGGILIMLPPAELENVVIEEDFNEDSRDAYGEIANIISGVLTSVFEEMYTQKLRFIRKDMREIHSARIDVSSDEPIPNKSYYTSSIPMTAEGKPLGQVHMLFPAELLGLDTPTVNAKQAGLREITGQESGLTKEDSTPEKQQSAGPSPAGDSGNFRVGIESQADLKKHKKKVDKVLSRCRSRMADEVSALLGTDVRLSKPENFIVSKEEFFFDEVSGKQVIADMDVLGELEGKSYLSIGLRDAIRVGGALIMLPATEIESVVAEEEFSEDTRDAYGEIANIISGVYTAIFEEQYTKRLRFVKTDLRQIAPMKVDIDADEPFPDQDYYVSRMDITLGDLALGRFNILFPADLLELSGLRTGEGIPADNEICSTSQTSLSQEKHVGEELRGFEEKNLTSLDILLVGDDMAEAAKIANVLEKTGYSVKHISFKDNLHNNITEDLKAIYLVMQDVNEQAFGVAIKVSSACSVPLIAAGPRWTRTTVIKAVKYGVRDILLTPASEEDIEENVGNNLFELAA
ncbi:MAG: hypothetical protein WBB19_16835 [Desulforhopalus sp.]